MEIKDLENNGIFLSEEPADKEALPDHVKGVRASLLDFDTVSSGAANNALTKQYEPIREEAERLHHGQDREAEWASFFHFHFFRPLEHELRVSAEDEGKDARFKFYYSYIEGAQCRPWTLFGQKKQVAGKPTIRKAFRQDDRKGLTEPKPDWVAFFPIRDVLANRIPTSNRTSLAEGSTAMTEKFEHATLHHLARHGVESSTAGLYQDYREERKWIPSDFICYPWLIVEHKRAGGGSVERKCHCQAANAAAAAVMMLESLFNYEPEAHEHNEANEHIPPVVSITTVAKLVRVWITYSCRPTDDDAAKYRMDCIWKGDMTLVSDLTQFRNILENARSWALIDQRPRISHRIGEWISKYPMKPKTKRGKASSSVLPTGSTSTSAEKAVLAASSSPVPSPNHSDLRPSSPRLVVGEQADEREESASDEEPPMENPVTEQESEKGVEPPMEKPSTKEKPPSTPKRPQPNNTRSDPSPTPASRLPPPNTTTNKHTNQQQPAPTPPYTKYKTTPNNPQSAWTEPLPAGPIRLACKSSATTLSPSPPPRTISRNHNPPIAFGTPGFSGENPFTPPPSAGNTPSKPARPRPDNRRRSGGSSDERGNSPDGQRRSSSVVGQGSFFPMGAGGGEAPPTPGLSPPGVDYGPARETCRGEFDDSD